MASNKKYWKSVEELNENSSIVDTLRQNEFVEEIPTDAFLGDKKTLEESSTTRRDFLKYVGFTTAAATLASCEGPVKKTIPYLNKPKELIPGVADFYATAIADGFDFANILVKVREGRPIKIEPNKEANGSTNARVQASVLSLYDSLRLKGPKQNGNTISWSDVDAQIIKKLKDIQAAGKTVAFLTSTDASPSTSNLIASLGDDVRHVIYDAVSESAALDAYETMYGSRALPSYDFSKARAIVSVGADFLGDWQGGGFDASYAKSRVPKNGEMSHHVQFESNMSLTGANADVRVVVKPTEQHLVMARLYQEIVRGISNREASPLNVAVQKAAAKIKKAGKNAVVVTGIQDANMQAYALAINNHIQSNVMDVVVTNNTRQGNDAEVMQLVADMKAGKIGALFINNSNPVYTLANSVDFVEGLSKVDLSVSFSMADNETAQATEYALATPHYLESWGLIEMKKGQYSLMQPTIQPLFDTRQFQDCLLKWSGNNQSYYEYLKTSFVAMQVPSSWNQALQDGTFTIPVVQDEEFAAKEFDLSYGYKAPKINGGFELQLYTKTSLGDGQQANNPWLQELPDPITRTSWDNYLTISAVDAKELGLKNWHTSNGALNGNYVTLTAGDVKLENVPVIIQPGQAAGSVGLALGYGRKAGMKKEMQTGVNAYALYQDFSTLQNVFLEKTSGEHHFASVQMQNTMVGRSHDIIRATTLEVFNTQDRDEWNPIPVVSKDHSEVSIRSEEADLWDSFDTSVGTHFNLSIDLNACNGCGACIVACHAENNVPVVGKEEVRKFRDMHWLRVDRYYSAAETFEQEIKDLEELPAFDSYEKVELAYQENPEVAFQPVMCQHCNHAPCESVCPVAATSHGRQGQNHMAYNRCVGTRYCANNCPYKVRRFNWFDYANNSEFDFNMNDTLGRMVLNPDVVVRSRGVMEKCSMCIQMTQASILKAKKEGRPVKDEEFQTACSNACSAGAMVFGDVNDKESEVSKLKEDERMYYLLEEVGTKPNVFYHVNVKNV